MTEPAGVGPEPATRRVPGDPAGYSFRDAMGGSTAATDAIVPTVLFAAIAFTDRLGLAAGVSLAWCAAVFVWRISRKQPLTMAASGLGGVLIGLAFALVAGEATAFFLPGIIGNTIFGLLCLASLPLRRPALAFTSAAIYRWPMEWYWHPRVRPAYSQMTFVWGAYYVGKAWWQYVLVQADELALLATVRLVTGWPGLLALLAFTYAWITWRLGVMDAPDVEEFKSDPQTGQAPTGE